MFETMELSEMLCGDCTTAVGGVPLRRQGRMAIRPGKMMV